MKILNLIYSAYQMRRGRMTQSLVNNTFKVVSAPEGAEVFVKQLNTAKETIANHAVANGVHIVVSKDKAKPESFLCSIISNLNNKNVVRRVITPNQKEYTTLVNEDGKIKVVRDDSFLRHFYRVISEGINSMQR